MRLQSLSYTCTVLLCGFALERFELQLVSVPSALGSAPGPWVGSASRSMGIFRNGDVSALTLNMCCPFSMLRFLWMGHSQDTGGHPGPMAMTVTAVCLELYLGCLLNQHATSNQKEAPKHHYGASLKDQP